MATSKQDYSPDMDGSAHGHHMTPPPAGVMGAHLMRKGKVMMMYTPMFMHMGGSRIGTRDVTPETIVTTVPNRFDQNPMMPGVQPPTLRIAPETINGVVTYTGVLTLDNSDMALLPGMTATAEIVVKHIDDALLVPNAALRYAPPAASQSSGSGGRGLIGMLMPRPPQGTSVAKVEEPASGERSIYVLENGAPKKLKIRIGVSDGSYTEVIEGPLKEGMAVITDSRSAK